MKIGTYFGIVFGKMTRSILRMLHRGGTTLPGFVAKFFNKNILLDLSQNVETVLITGTNGKSTSLYILEHLLDIEGISYFSNYEGANIETGIISTFVSNTKLKRQSIHSIALIECDELYVDRICKQLHPKIILITNLYEDQKERFGNVTHLAGILSKVLNDNDATQCINKDCEILSTINKNNDKKIIEYSIIDNSIYINNQKIAIKTNLPGLWNLYNVAGACAVACALDIDIDKLSNAFTSIKMPYGRMEEINIQGIKIILNLAKNPCSIDLLLEYIVKHEDTDAVVIGINNKPGDIEDPKWLNNAKNLSLLNNFNSIWICGNCTEIIEKILSKTVLDKNKIKTIETPSKVIENVVNNNFKVNMLLNYTCMMETRKTLVKLGYIKKDFWKK